MDPDATVRDIVDAIEEGRGDDARDSLKHLLQWMSKGGFAPKIAFADLEFLLQELHDRLPK